MEYGIHFDNDNANNDILDALEELNNTFFIEILSSDDEKNEKNASDSSEHEVVDDINDLEENFNKMHLSNFEFVENSDSYINDEVYDKLKLEVENFFKGGKCTCSSNCFKKIVYEQFLAR